MLEDVVVDTNVLVDAQNPSVSRFSEALAFVNALLDSGTLLCVDEGFDVDEQKNRSHIGAEYLEHLPVGTFSYAAIAKLASTQRLSLLSVDVPVAVARRINQLIRNRRDRTFLRIAYKSSEMVLASHDYVDFQAPKRQQIRREFDIDVIEANACHAKLLR